MAKQVTGLSTLPEPTTIVVEAGQTYQLQNYDDVIVTGAGATLILPQNPQAGETHQITAAFSYSLSGSPAFPLSSEPTSMPPGAIQWSFTDATNGWESSNPTLSGGEILNLDTAFGHTPALVRYQSRVFTPPLAGANETTANYWRYDNTIGFGFTQQYGFYFEVTSLQNYAGGGCATKTIHRGHGDAHYVALLNGISPVGIADATGLGVTPAVLRIPNHGFGNGDIVTVVNALGNTAINGTTYGIIVLDDNHIALPGVTGNGVYTPNSGTAQDIAPPVGYEGAQWGDGCTSFLASQQFPGGRPNATYFNALVQADAILNYGCFVANDTPNAAFVANKRTGLADGAIDGYSQFAVRESLLRATGGNGGGTFKGTWNVLTAYIVGDVVASVADVYRCTAPNTGNSPPNGAFWLKVTDTPNLGRIRMAVYNSGQIDQQSLVAETATPLRDSPIHRLLASYWDGAAAQTRVAYQVLHIDGVAQASFRTYAGPLGSETVRDITADNAPLYYRVGPTSALNSQTFANYKIPVPVQTVNAVSALGDSAYRPPDGHSAKLRVSWQAKNIATNVSVGGEATVQVHATLGVLTIDGQGATAGNIGDASLAACGIGFAVSGGNTLLINCAPPGGYAGTLDWSPVAYVEEN